MIDNENFSKLIEMSNRLDTISNEHLDLHDIIMQHAPFFLCILDMNWKIVAYTDSWKNMYLPNYEHAIVGERIDDIFPIIKDHSEHFDLAYSGEVVSNTTYDTDYFNDDGQRVQIYVKYEPYYKDDKLYGILIWSFDVTPYNNKPVTQEEIKIDKK